MHKKRQELFEGSLSGGRGEKHSKNLKNERIFLLEKLIHHSENPLIGVKDNNFTKNGAKPCADLYNRTFADSDSNSNSRIQKAKGALPNLPRTITGEAISNFLKLETYTESKLTVNQLAGLILVLEDCIEKEECLILIRDKKAWTLFKEHFEDEITPLEIYSKLAGNYFLLSYDHKPANLIRTPLRIKNSGLFEITCSNGHFEGDLQVTQIGSDSYLHLNIQKKRINNNEIGFTGYFIFYINQLLGNLNSGNPNAFHFIDTLAGVSIRINSDGEPQVKKEFLIPSKGNHFTDENFKKIKFKYLDIDFLDNLKGFGENSNVGDDFYKFLARSLRGREGNIIVASKSAYNNTNINRIRDVEYQELYLNSFFYEIIFLKEKDNSKIYKYLYEALLHGADLRLINSKITDIFSTINVSEKQKKEIHALIIEITVGIAYLYRHGIEQLIEILTIPQNVINQNSSILAANIQKFIALIRELREITTDKK